MIKVKLKQAQTSELDFINRFLFSDFFEKPDVNPSYNYTIIQEPFTGLGYADLVCVVWDKVIKEKWNCERSKLKPIDIKILHHLYNCNVYKAHADINKELGFSDKQVEKCINILNEANLIKINRQSKIKIKSINEIFFVKDIISLEAKLHDWKGAFFQSMNNLSFASKSFALFPEKIINNKLLNYYKNSDIGIISFDENYRVVKKPKKKLIPSTLNSWFFNEYIGRNSFE